MAVIANVALTNTFDTWRLRTNVGFTRLNAFAIDESSLYANTLTANVAFTAKGTATVTGLLTASGRAIVGTNLTVSGNTTLGAANKTITTTGLIAHTGRATISTNLDVSGNVAITGISTFTGAANFNGAVTLGDASTDLTTISGRVTIGTNLNVSGNAVITGISTFNGAASFNGAVTLGDAATDLTTVNGRVTIGQNLNVSGNTTLNGTTTDRSNSLSQTLADGATINWDTSLGRVATVTLGDNRTFAAPTNLKVGTYILNVIQDGTGSRIITWDSVFKWTAGVAPPLTTAANRRDIFSFFSDGTNLYGSFMPDVR
jgi:ethanolamine utilization microcompartment shell protein EutS